jgi:hypothetical protein
MHQLAAAQSLCDVPLAGELTRRLAAAGLGNEYPQPINTFVVKTPKSLILVDTGLGDFPTKIPVWRESWASRVTAACPRI